MSILSWIWVWTISHSCLFKN